MLQMKSSYLFRLSICSSCLYIVCLLPAYPKVGKRGGSDAVEGQSQLNHDIQIKFLPVAGGGADFSKEKTLNMN